MLSSILPAALVPWSPFIGGWVFLYTAYTAFNLFLQVVCYGDAPFSTRSDAPRHHFRVFSNLAIASTFCGAVCWAIATGRSALRFEWDFGVRAVAASAATATAVNGTASAGGGVWGSGYDLSDGSGAALAWYVATVAAWTIGASVYEGVIEYYWHRAMHLPWLYQRMHKIHHYHKRPEPFDDLYVHPLEVSGYYTILFSPAMVLRGMPLHAFVCYMVYMGLCGVLDHSGLRVDLPLGLYNTADHALHHSKFECNYGFPHPFMDLLHGTYTGTIWGRTYNTLLRAPQLTATAAAPPSAAAPAAVNVVGGAGKAVRVVRRARLELLPVFVLSGGIALTAATIAAMLRAQ